MRFVQVWCVYEKYSGAGVGEVCAGLMQTWEGFRSRSGWGLRRFDASMRRIQMQVWVRFVQVWCLYKKDSEHDWVRFVQVWCLFEKDPDAGVGEVCAVLMLVWEGFRGTIGWGLCRFDAIMRRIQMQEWLRFVKVWCSYEKDLDAGVSEMCAGLVHAWEGFWRKSWRGLCRFDAFYEKDSEAGLVEVCAGLMLVWEGLRRSVCEVCAGLMRVWEIFRRRSGWGLCRFDANMRRIQKQEWVRFAQVWCKHEKDSDASVGEICAGLMLV